MTILIVEDHPVLRDKLAGHFSRAGFAADAVGGGADALAYLDRRNYDIMVLDLGLPDMDGMELLARRGGARCLILTARDALEDRLKGLDLGADDYVLKPFEMAELEARVRAVLRRADNAAAPVLRNAVFRYPFPPCGGGRASDPALPQGRHAAGGAAAFLAQGGHQGCSGGTSVQL